MELTKAGSMMGSGGMIVMDEDNLHGRDGPVFFHLPRGANPAEMRTLPRRPAPDARHPEPDQ